MSTDVAKIRIKFGQTEIEYEGESSLLKDDLFNLAERYLSLYDKNKILIVPESAVSAVQVTPQQLGSIDYSTNTIAAHLEVNTGTDLVIAAAAHLMMVKGQKKFTRKEINDEMKLATTYYKSSMSSNLTKSFDTLVKAKRLNQVSKHVYALSASEMKTLESKLAG